MITQYTAKDSEGKSIVLKLKPNGQHSSAATAEENLAARTALDIERMASNSQNWPSANEANVEFLEVFLGIRPYTPPKKG